MRKIGLGIFIAVVALTLSGVAVAIPNQAADVAKEKAKAPDLEKIEFIHWKKGFAKPPCNNDGICDPEENPSCGDCKGGGNGEEKPTPTATCYAFMGQYGKKLLKWRKSSVSYVINPVNPVQVLDEDFVISAIFAGAEEWDANTGTDLFGSYSVDYNATYGVQNYVNAITWDDYPTEGVIGVATVWYSPATKTIVEFDIMFDIDWTWGDATGDETIMDLQNIATHELGHGVGLADVYEAECRAVTMYGYSDYGETQKRDLEPSDITGIQKLYGGF